MMDEDSEVRDHFARVTMMKSSLFKVLVIRE